MSTAFLLLITAGLAAPVPPAAPAVNGDTTLPARIDAFLARDVEAGLWSGTVVVARGDSVLHLAGYGMANLEHGVPNTPTTRFPVASVSKAFTAIAAAWLWEASMIDREGTIDRWLPDFLRGDEITIAHLVGHRSGIRDADDLPWFGLGQRIPHSLEELVDSLGAAGLESRGTATATATAATPFSRRSCRRRRDWSFTGACELGIRAGRNDGQWRWPPGRSRGGAGPGLHGQADRGVGPRAVCSLIQQGRCGIGLHYRG